jgi:hypothetical protein
MRSLRIFGVAMLALTNPALGRQQSPYVEYQGRSIMALSAEQIGSYLAGDGMGFALAAELNGYPGPRHVLELADSLSLDTVQQERVQAAFDSMRSRARVLGAAVVDQEQILDSLFAAGTITNERLESILAQLAQLQGQLRAVHLTAHVALVDVLSEHQIREYQRLRGYSAEQHQHQRSH